MMLSSAIKKRFNDLESLISNGHHSKAYKEINYIKKKTKLSNEQRLQMSVWLHWLGYSEEALKILGKPLNYNELMIIEDHSLIKINIRIAHMLSYTGAISMAEFIFNDIDKVLEIKNIDINGFYPQYYNTLGNHYLRIKKYQKSLDAFTRFKSNIDELDSKSFFNLLGICDSLNGLGHGEKAIAKLLSIESSVNDANYKGIYYQAKGEYLLAEGEIEKSIEALEVSRQEFNEESKFTKDYAYLELTYGKSISCLEKSLSSFYRAKEILERGYINTEPYLKTLKLIKEYGGKLSGKEERAIYINNRLEDGSVLLISENTTEETSYKNALATPGVTIDLYEKNALINNEKVDLNLREICVIKNLVLASSFGIHEMALNDCLFQDKYQGHEHLINRLKKIVSRIRKKLNLNIVWKKRRLYLEELPGSIILSLS